MSDDHVVEYADAEQRADVDQPLSSGLVLGTRCRIAARVVVDEDRGCRRAQDEDLDVPATGSPQGEAGIVCYVDRRGDGGSKSMIGAGWHDDRYVRTAAGWRFASRKIVLDFFVALSEGWVK